MRLINVITCDGNLNFLRCVAARLEHNERALKVASAFVAGKKNELLGNRNVLQMLAGHPVVLNSNRHFAISMRFKS